MRADMTCMCLGWPDSETDTFSTAFVTVGTGKSREGGVEQAKKGYGMVTPHRRGRHEYFPIQLYMYSMIIPSRRFSMTEQISVSACTWAGEAEIE
jgi:hypothetical protein